MLNPLAWEGEAPAEPHFTPSPSGSPGGSPSLAYSQLLGSPLRERREGVSILLLHC